MWHSRIILDLEGRVRTEAESKAQFFNTQIVIS